jgi:hypothetical protein
MKLSQQTNDNLFLAFQIITTLAVLVYSVLTLCIYIQN